MGCRLCLSLRFCVIPVPVSAYYLANMTLEALVSSINASLFGVIAYFLIDYPALTQPSSVPINFLIYLAALVAQTNTASMILMACALLSPNQDVAFTTTAGTFTSGTEETKWMCIAAPLVCQDHYIYVYTDIYVPSNKFRMSNQTLPPLIVCPPGIHAVAVLAAGFIVPFPKFFGPANWLQWTSHLKYTFQATLINAFSDTRLYPVLPTLGLTNPGTVWTNLLCSLGFYAGAFVLGYVCLANLNKERR